MIVENHANPFIPELHLFHSRKKYAKFVERHDGDCSEMSDAAGQMTYMDGMAAILIDCDEDWHSEAALLVHEAYHAAVAHFIALGETEPGEEVMAYAIQVISGSLFYAHDEWKQGRSEQNEDSNKSSGAN